jgi:hypothetical protein
MLYPQQQCDYRHVKIGVQYKTKICSKVMGCERRSKNVKWEELGKLFPFMRRTNEFVARHPFLKCNV